MNRFLVQDPVVQINIVCGYLRKYLNKRRLNFNVSTFARIE